MDSSQVGYLRPIQVPIEGDDLDDFLQKVAVGITGIPGPLVRPRWQDEPPNAPEFGTNWAAIGETERLSDTFPFEEFVENTGLVVVRSQELNVLLTFYGPLARSNAQAFESGIGVKQNQESLSFEGYSVIEVGRMTFLADLQHNRWVKRVDINFKLRRTVVYVYPVQSLVGILGNLNDIAINITPALPMFAFGLNSPYASGWGTGQFITQGVF